MSRHVRATPFRGEPGPAHQPVGQLRGLLGDPARIRRCSVLTNVGHSTVTATPVPDSSAASVSDSDSTPGLADVVGGHPGCRAERRGRGDVDDAARSADVPASRRIGAKTWQPWIGPHRLMPRTHFQLVEARLADGQTARTDAGVVDHQRWASPPNQDCACFGQCGDVVESARRRSVRRVASPPSVDDGVGRAGAPTFVDVAAHHPAAALGEFRWRTPHRCRCPRR